MAKLILGFIFIPLTGLMFIWFGFQRLLGTGKSNKPGEAVFWGAFGILLGIGVIASAVWFVIWAENQPPTYGF